MSAAHVFGGYDALLRDESGAQTVVRGDVMPARSDLMPGEEIFYRYGVHTNAELLAIYGFVVPPALAREHSMIGLRTVVKLTTDVPLLSPVGNGSPSKPQLGSPGSSSA